MSPTQGNNPRASEAIFPWILRCFKEHYAPFSRPGLPYPWFFKAFNIGLSTLCIDGVLVYLVDVSAFSCLNVDS